MPNIVVLTEDCAGAGAGAGAGAEGAVCKCPPPPLIRENIILMHI